MPTKKMSYTFKQPIVFEEHVLLERNKRAADDDDDLPDRNCHVDVHCFWAKPKTTFRNKRMVHFQLEANVAYCPILSHDDVQSMWISEQEQAQAQRALSALVRSHSTDLSDDCECLRGLEHLIGAGAASSHQKRQRQIQGIRQAVLQEARWFNPKSTEEIALVSILLSAADVACATRMAHYDMIQAMTVHFTNDDDSGNRSGIAATHPLSSTLLVTSNGPRTLSEMEFLLTATNKRSRLDFELSSSMDDGYGYCMFSQRRKTRVQAVLAENVRTEYVSLTERDDNIHPFNFAIVS